MRPPLLLPTAFFVADLVTRLILRNTETRWQILAFALLALLSAVFVQSLRLRTMIISAAAAIVGVLIAKFSIEGWPV